MNMANDIANLLRRFGANADGYLEVESALDYKELPLTSVTAPAKSVQVSANEVEGAALVPARKIAPTPLSVAVVSTLHPMAERVEPVTAEAPAVSEVANVAPPATASVSVISSSLRSLLSEAALKRQAEANARNEEAARQSALNSLPPVTPAQVIAVVSPKGGVGKSTICAALAGALNLKGRTIAIDLDPQNALQYHMGVAVDDNGTAGTGLTGENWISLLRDGAAGTHVLPYGSVSEKERRVLEGRLEEDGHWLARQLARMNLGANDVVILDTPPGSTPYLDQALDVADQVVVVVMPDAGSFMALDQIDRLLEGHTGKFGRDDCSYVVNQFDASRTFCQDMLEVLKRRFGTKLIGVVPLDHAISEGLAFGMTPLLEGEVSPARQEILAISNVLKSDVLPPILAGGRAS
jgi:cellulose synthase operon protein YhjQ